MLYPDQTLVSIYKGSGAMSGAMLQCSPVGRCATAPFQGSTKALRAAAGTQAHRSVHESHRGVCCSANGQQHPMVRRMRTGVQVQHSNARVLLHSAMHAWKNTNAHSVSHTLLWISLCTSVM